MRALQQNATSSRTKLLPKYALRYLWITPYDIGASWGVSLTPEGYLTIWINTFEIKIGRLGKNGDTMI